MKIVLLEGTMGMSFILGRHGNRPLTTGSSVIAEELGTRKSLFVCNLVLTTSNPHT